MTKILERLIAIDNPELNAVPDILITRCICWYEQKYLKYV